MVQNLINKLKALTGKNIEDSSENELIITAATTAMLFVLKTANLKPPIASLDAMEIIKPNTGNCGGALVKVMHFTKSATTGK